MSLPLFLSPLPFPSLTSLFFSFSSFPFFSIFFYILSFPSLPLSHLFFPLISPQFPYLPLFSFPLFPLFFYHPYSFSLFPFPLFSVFLAFPLPTFNLHTYPSPPLPYPHPPFPSLGISGPITLLIFPSLPLTSPRSQCQQSIPQVTKEIRKILAGGEGVRGKDWVYGRGEKGGEKLGDVRKEGKKG